jgi:hypothetical protein
MIDIESICTSNDFYSNSFERNEKKGFQNCTVLNGIECLGSNNFLRMEICKRKSFSNYHFTSTLVLSLFL